MVQVVVVQVVVAARRRSRTQATARQGREPWQRVDHQRGRRPRRQVRSARAVAVICSRTLVPRRPRRSARVRVVSF